MKTHMRLNSILLFIGISFFMFKSVAQPSLRSLLINHGSNTCGSATPQQQLIAGTISGSPSMVYGGANGVPYYSVYTAYNPKDKMIYFADITGGITRVYAMDYNLTGVIQSPSTTTPTYIYPFMIDQFCFDQNGNNIALYNYNAGTATGRVKSMDLASGADIPGTDKQIDFPAGLQPNGLSWGDIVFMPNGRIFMAFGNSPSRLYELINFNGPGNATAVYLADLPRPCFSIGYVDGNLIVGGSDGGGCYYYTWDITAHTLSNANAFPLGMTTADISHMNVGVGVSEELASSTLIGSGVANLEYHIVIKNKGNISLANVQFQNNLAATFGAGNISNLSVDFLSNPAGLVLNPMFNGETDLNILQPGQTIDNFPVAADSVILRIRLRASGLIPSVVYLNSTIANGQVGAGANLMDVRDSSNNGNVSMIDIDNNGVSDDLGEGVPTPYQYLVLLPYGKLDCDVQNNNGDITVNWQTSNELHMDHYEVERSTDGRNFSFAGNLKALNQPVNKYKVIDHILSQANTLYYYRIKIFDEDGNISYSKIMQVKTTASPKSALSVYPNPIQSDLHIQLESVSSAELELRLFDVSGKLIQQSLHRVQTGLNDVSIKTPGSLEKGIYFLKWKKEGEQGIIKLIK